MRKIFRKIEIKTHLKRCHVCRNGLINNFEIIKKCMSDHEAKINDALFTKKKIPN